jgi:MoxR-like ATPase
VTHPHPTSATADSSSAIPPTASSPNGLYHQGATEQADTPVSIDQVGPEAQRIITNIEKVIAGKYEVIRLGVTVLLAEGHLLIEDVPGVGKTTFAKALARSIDCSVRRLQFTPDLLPSDVTGVSIYNTESTDFEFKPGPVFANIVLGDEINRASPKTQAALLECMAERQVTVDGIRYELQSPFLVLATQNPVEMEGTYALPEAQRDRFTAKISLGYPDRNAEMAMLSDQTTTVDPLTVLEAVSDASRIRALIDTVRGVHVADAVKSYVVALAEATRDHNEIRLGASPRASLHLLRTAKSAAAMSGRDFVLPDDVQQLAVAVLAHRIIPAAAATVAGRAPEDLLAEIVAKVPIPSASQRA